MEAFTIASAAVSIVLGAFAIWLSIVFYRMSVASSNRIQDTSNELSSNVNRLEKLFEHLYSDTFSIMRDTYSDMRKHVWPEVTGVEEVKQIEARTDSKITNIRTELLKQIDTIAARTGGTGVKQLQDQLSPLVDEAISRSRNAETEAREETLRDFVINQVRSAREDGISAGALYDVVRKAALGSLDNLFAELQKLKNEHIIAFSVDKSQRLAPDDTISYVQDSPQSKKD